MKGILCTLVVFALLGFMGKLPFVSHDAAELSPIETLIAEFTPDFVRLTGDGDQLGIGKTWDEAVENLKQTTSGIAFLETAQKIIVNGDLAKAVSAIANSVDLRPAAEIFQIDIAKDIQAVGEYLQTRTSPLTVSELQTALGTDFVLPQLHWEHEKVLLDD